jgi:hypothetical protein
MKTESRTNIAKQIRNRILRSRDRTWRVEDFEGSSNAVQAELRRLVQAGELEHVRRGVYWRGHQSRFGLAGARQGEALRGLIGDKEAVGAAGWYATNLLGLSTQISPVEVLSLTRRPPTGFGDLRLIDRSRRVGRRDSRLNDLEVTFLEALEGWDRFVELSGDQALRRFSELLDNEQVRADRLVAATRTEPAVVRERLRQVLLHHGDEAWAEKIERARSVSARERALAVIPEAVAA